MFFGDSKSNLPSSRTDWPAGAVSFLPLSDPPGSFERGAGRLSLSGFRPGNFRMLFRQDQVGRGISSRCSRIIPYAPLSAWEKALWVLVLGVVVIARLHGLADESFWVDEVFSAVIVSEPFGAVLNSIPNDKPPLDYYVQAAFHRLGAVEEFWHRLHSVLAGIAMAVGVYWWALVLFGRRVALIAFILAACNPIFLRYAQEARPYSLIAALIAGQQAVFYIWWRSTSVPGYRARRARTLLLVLLALSVLAVCTMYSALLVFFAQFAFLLTAAAFRGPKRLGARKKRPRSYLKPLGLYLGLFALVILSAIPLASRSDVKQAADYFWRFQGIDLGLIVNCLSVQLFWGLDGDALKYCGLTVALLIALGLCLALKRNGHGAL